MLKQRKTWTELWERVQRGNRAGKELTKEDMVWAMESVLSRAFKGSFGSGGWVLIGTCHQPWGAGSGGDVS